MLPSILPRRGLSYPGSFKQGYDLNHIASAPNKGVGGTGATSLSVVAKGANAVNLLKGARGTATSMTAKMDGIIGPSVNFGTSITFPGSTTCPSIYTFAAIVRPSALAGFIYTMIATSNGTGGLAFRVDSSNIPVTVVNSNASPGAAFAMTNGIPYFVAVSCNLTDTSNYIFNQVQVNLKTGQTLSTSFTSSLGAIGGITAAQAGTFFLGNASFPWTGVLAAAMAESVFLTLPQLQQWAQDPWSYWYPTKYNLPLMLGAGSSSAAYTLTASAGAYTLSGKTANLNSTRTLTAAQGSYSLSGQSAGTIYGRKLTAAQGSYSLSGQSAGLNAARKILPTAGSYTLSGQTAGLTSARKLTASQGTYTLSGQAATLSQSSGALNYTLAAGTGTYTVSGQNAALTSARTLTATHGTYTVTGQTANVNKALIMPAAHGTYTLSGLPAAGHIALSIKPTTGSYALTGMGAVLSSSASGGTTTNPNGHLFFSPTGQMLTNSP